MVMLENCALLVYYAVSSGNFLPIFWDNLLVPSSGVKKMGQISCPEMSVRNYHYSLRNIPEVRSSHLLCSRSLNSCNDHASCHWMYRAKATEDQSNLLLDSQYAPVTLKSTLLYDIETA